MKQVEITSKVVGRGESEGFTSAIPSINLSGFALKSDLLTLEKKFSDFLNVPIIDGTINRWSELETFLAGISENYNLLSLLNGKADKSYVDTNFVTIAGTEDVTGLHNFVNGLKVGGIELIQKNGNAFLKGNLVVEGGITMYGDGEGGSSIPSYSTLGSLENVDKDSIDAVASVDRVLFQSAGSNVWSWKALSEIGGGSSGGESVSGDYLPLSGGTLKGTLNTQFIRPSVNAAYQCGTSFLRWDNIYSVYGNFSNSITINGSTAVHEGNISSYNAGSATKLQTARTIWGQSFNGTGNVSGNIYIPNNSDIVFKDSVGTDRLTFSLGSNNNLAIGYGTSSAGYSTIIYGNSIILKYGTSRIEGLRLNSSGNLGINTDSPTHKLHVNGTLRVGGSTLKSTYLNLNRNSEDGSIYDSTKTALEVEALADLSLLRTYNVTTQVNLSLHKNGCIGIGTLSPSYMLDVDGDFRSKGIIIEKTDEINRYGGALFLQHRGTIVGSQGSARTGGVIMCANGGNVGVGTTAPSQKLHVAGNILTTGGITMYSDIRKKTKLQDVELSLSQISNAPLIQHYYNSDQEKTTHVGSIAQYWAELNDWFCKLDNEGYYTMEIQNCALASAISIARHLEKYESKTDKKIRQLKKRISQLEDELELLKKGV